VKPRWQRDLHAHVVRVSSWDEAPAADVVVADSWRVAQELDTIETPARKFHFIQHDERLYHGSPEQVAAVYRLSFEKIVVSTWLQDMLQRDFGQKALLLLNPMDRTLFFPVTIGRDADTIRVLLLDHDYAWKGTAEGAEIIERLKEGHPEIRLVMFGVRKTGHAHAADEYHFSPPQEKLREIYSSCDIYLCPSWDEGSGLPSMEAMVCGSALVTYDNGGSRDYAIDGETAFVAAHHDKETLAAKLEMAVSDGPLRRKISSAGMAYIESMPTRDEQADHLERILTTPCK
jgi:glycosyltransferase involved in cell wall biosynthesis